MTPFPGNGQSLFTIPDTNIVITKSTNFGVLHDFAEIVNLTSDSLDMRWLCRFSADLPQEWSVSLDDQDNYHPVLVSGDSSNFTLHTDTVFPNKMIIGIMHNGTTGTGTITPTVFPATDRSDSAHINFIVTVTKGSGGTGLEIAKAEFEAIIDNDQLTIHSGKLMKHLAAFDLNGRKVLGLSPNSMQARIDIRSWPAGYYTLVIAPGHTVRLWKR